MASAPLLATLLSLAASFLALSLLVQIIQEIYKYLTSSKAVSYEKALVDFLGPHAAKLKRPGTLPELQVRGPFQFLRRRPTGRLQPMDRETLARTLERTAAPWIQRALDALHFEASIQKETPGEPSPAFQQFLRELAGADPGSPGYFTAVELREFVETWGAGSSRLDAVATLRALHQRFLPSVIQAGENFSQLATNVEYSYRRRNLRQTFVIGFIMALVLHFPADRLYSGASQASLEQAIAAAEQARAIYALEASRDTSAARSVTELRAKADTLAGIVRLTKGPATLEALLNRAAFLAEFTSFKTGFYYLIGCLLTSLLLSFGAPFWNDLTGVLLRYAKGASSPVVDAPKRQDD